MSTADSRRSWPQDQWLRRLAAHCWRYRRLTLMALGGSLLATAVTAVIPLIQRDIIDNAILAHRQPIWPGAVLLIIAALLNFGGVYIRRYRGGRLSLDVQHSLRTELFGSPPPLDRAPPDQPHPRQIPRRSISDLNMVQSLLSMVPMLVGNAVLFVLSLVIMVFLSPLLTVVALAVGPALWLIALGGWLAINGSITIGTFFAFSAYLAQLVGPVRALTGLVTIGQEARASVIRVYEVIDSRPVLTEK